MRKRRNILVVCSVVILCLIFLVSLTSSQPVKNKSALDSPQANGDVVGMYREIIRLREQALSDELKLLEYGRSSFLGITKAKMKISETRIELAEFQGKNDIVVEELRNVVRFYSEAIKQLKMEVEKGQRTPNDFYEAEIALLEAKIRLAKAIQ
jgi:hypothetical protein